MTKKHRLQPDLAVELKRFTQSVDPQEFYWLTFNNEGSSLALNRRKRAAKAKLSDIEIQEEIIEYCAVEMASVQTINLTHLPLDLAVHIALYTDLQNAPFLRDQLLQGNPASEYALIDASVVRRPCSLHHQALATQC